MQVPIKDLISERFCTWETHSGALQQEVCTCTPLANTKDFLMQLFAQHSYPSVQWYRQWLGEGRKERERDFQGCNLSWSPISRLKSMYHWFLSCKTNMKPLFKSSLDNITGKIFFCQNGTGRFITHWRDEKRKFHLTPKLWGCVNASLCSMYSEWLNKAPLRSQKQTKNKLSQVQKLS